MTSTALAPVSPGLASVIDNRYLLRFQVSTRQPQRTQRATLPTPDTPWFETLWTKAIEANAESAWHLLPEEVFDLVDDRDEDLEPSDAQFLGFAAVSPDVPTMAAVAAIRLMGILAEEGKLETSVVLPMLRDVLGHDDPQRRYYGVKAIWQARARGGLPALRRRLERETSTRVKAIIERAVAVLE